MYWSRAHFDEEQDIDSVQRDRFNGEAIASEHLGSVVVEKSTPGTPTTLWRRRQVMASHDIAHGTAIQFITQFEQLALYLVKTHARIFACQADNQVFQF